MSIRSEYDDTSIVKDVIDDIDYVFLMRLFTQTVDSSVCEYSDERNVRFVACGVVWCGRK